MVVTSWKRFRRAFVAGLLVLIVAGCWSLTGCRRQPPVPEPGPGEQGELPGGDSGGVEPEPSDVVPSSLEPLDLTVLTAEDGNLALGPLDNYFSHGWVPGEPDQVWGWGHLEGFREQFYFTLGTDGTLEAMRIPESLALGSPVPAPGACLGVHRGEGGWRAWRLPFEGPPAELCPAQGEKESPSGAFVLWFGLENGAVLHDKRSGAMTPVGSVPSWEFPYSGCATQWVDDTLVVVRSRDEATGSRGLEFTRLPDGEVLAREVRPGRSLSPFPSPDGKWVAVLAIDRATALWPEEAVFEFDAGQELAVHSHDTLGAGTSAGISLTVPSGSLATSLVWAPDGSKLAFATVSSVDCADMLIAYEGPASVCLATAPAFETRTLALQGLGGLWLPASLSPEGRYLLLRTPQDAEGRQTALVWDVETDQAAALSPSQPGAALDLLQFIWVGPGLFLSRETAGDEEYRVLVDLSTGEARRLPWPVPDGSPWFGAASGGYIALEALVRPGESLGPLGRVEPGRYLVLSPLRGR